MPFACEKLRDLDRQALLAAIDPVLFAHRVHGVELIWRTDQRGWVLYLTVERPGFTPGAGVTLDECSELSRDLSLALDVANVIPNAYRLEVGTPGLERQLYGLEDYRRFAGQTARVKLRQPIEGQRLLRGGLLGLSDDQRIIINTDNGIFEVPLQDVDSAQLVFEVPGQGGSKKKPGRSKKPGASPQVGDTTQPDDTGNTSNRRDDEQDSQP